MNEQNQIPVEIHTLGGRWNELHENLVSLYAQNNEYKLKLEALKPSDPMYATYLTILASTQKSIGLCKENLAKCESAMVYTRGQAEAEAKAALLPSITRYAPIGNYYGTPCVFRKGSRYYFAIGDVHGDQCVEVTYSFYQGFLDSFPVSFDFDESDETIEVREPGSQTKTHVFTLLAPVARDDEGDDE